MRPYTVEEAAFESINFMLASWSFILPVIVESFKTEPPRVDVKPALNLRQINEDKTVSWIERRSLEDVPVYISRAGGFTITMPIKKGDRGIILVLDSNISEFLKTGALSNTGASEWFQSPRRRNLADSIYMPGWCLKLDNFQEYMLDGIAVRSDDNKTYVQVKQTDVNVLAATNVNIEAKSDIKVLAESSINVNAISNIEVKGDSNVNIEAGSNTTVKGSSITIDGSNVRISSNTNIDNRMFLMHTHSGVMSGPSTSGPVI